MHRSTSKVSRGKTLLTKKRNTEAVGVGFRAPKAGALSFCAVRESDYAAVLLNSKWKGRTNQFGWLQAPATNHHTNSRGLGRFGQDFLFASEVNLGEESGPNPRRLTPISAIGVAERVQSEARVITPEPFLAHLRRYI